MDTKDNNCPFHRLVFEKYIFNEISPEDDKKLQEHIKSCRQCKKNIEIIKKKHKILKKHKTIKLSKGFKKNLFNKIHSVDKKITKSRKIKQILSIAAMVPIFISAIITYQNAYKKYSDIPHKVTIHYKHLINKKSGPYYFKDRNLEKNINKHIKAYLAKKGLNKDVMHAKVYVSKKPRRIATFERYRYGKGRDYYGKMGKGGIPGRIKYVTKPGKAVVLLRINEKDLKQFKETFKDLSGIKR